MRLLVRQGRTHQWISTHYRLQYGNHRRLSQRSFRRFCHEHNLTRVVNKELDEIVGHFVHYYGDSYGRRMMQGSVRQHIGVVSVC